MMGNKNKPIWTEYIKHPDQTARFYLHVGNIKPIRLNQKQISVD